jgi:N-acetylglucosamine-6-phosphate deacetylase
LAFSFAMLKWRKSIQGQGVLMLIINNIHVLGYQNNGLQTIAIDDGKLSFNPSIQKEEEAQVIEANGEYYLMPGLLDAHIHGYAGCDFADANKDSLPTMTKALADTGLSYCVATLVSLKIPQLKQSLSAIDEYVRSQQESPSKGRSNIVAVHLEGPFIAENCKGAHAKDALQSSITIDKFKDIISAAPHISEWKITLAPDIEGAIDFIRDSRNLSVNGRKVHVQVFIGHSNADEAKIKEAIEAGAVGFTHLGNANCEQATRSQTVEEAKLSSHVVKWVAKNHQAHPFSVELIHDGAHISEAFAAFIYKTLGDRIILITDALGPSGLKDGEYLLGSLPILKKAEQFVLRDNPEKLAGSAANLASIINKFSQLSVVQQMPIENQMEAIYKAVIANPRETSLDKSIQLRDDSNFVILNSQHQLVLSACNGQLVRHQVAQKHVATFSIFPPVPQDAPLNEPKQNSCLK